MAFTTGKYAKAICDRCGDKVKYTELQLEWTGFRVCRACFDEKDPREFPSNFPVDPQALEDPRPDNDIEAGEGLIRESGTSKVGSAFRSFQLEANLNDVIFDEVTDLSFTITDPPSGLWQLANSATLVFGATDAYGGSTAMTLDDSNVAAVGVLNYASVTGLTISKTQTFKYFLKKDSTPGTTRLPIFRMFYTGSTSESVDYYVDTMTGASNAIEVNPSNITAEVIDYNSTYWQVVMTGKSNNQANTYGYLQIIPAFSVYSGGWPTGGIGGALTGSIVIMQPILMEQ